MVKLSRKASRQVATKKGKPRALDTIEKPASAASSGVVGEADAERVAGVDDQAIKSYKTFYEQGWAAYRQRLRHGAYYPYCDSPGYADYPYTTQTADAYETGYEGALQSIEQGIAAFTTEFQCIQGLEKAEQEPYIRDWKEYLQSLLETSRQLARSIEESMSSMLQKS